MNYKCDALESPSGALKILMHAIASVLRPGTCRWLCAALERFLGEVLQQELDYRSCWVDDVVPRWDFVPEAVKVPVTGRVDYAWLSNLGRKRARPGIEAITRTRGGP